jgi:hypothetical protein
MFNSRELNGEAYYRAKVALSLDVGSLIKMGFQVLPQFHN